MAGSFIFRVFLISLCLIVSSTFAEIVYVSNSLGNDTTSCGSYVSPCASIEVGVLVANSSDTIMVDSGIYNVDTVIVIMKNLTLQSNLTNPAVLQCANATSAFFFGGDITLDGFHITGCTNSAIYIGGNNTLITNSLFTENHRPSATAACIHLYASNSTSLRVINSTFTDNSVVGDGGVISMNSLGTEDLLLVENCIFLRNSADTQGGAIDVSAAMVIIRNSTFDSNSCSGLGGAICLAQNIDLQPNPIFIIEDSVFTNNVAAGKLASGGAVYVTGTNYAISITGTEFSNNSVLKSGKVDFGGGGAAYITGIREFSMNNSVVNFNLLLSTSATLNTGGAGISLVNFNSGVGNVFIENSSFLGNAITAPVTLAGSNLAVSGMDNVVLHSMEITGENQTFSVESETLRGTYVYVSAVNIFLENCNFSDNDLILKYEQQSASIHGAMFSFAGSNITVSNTIFTGNVLTTFSNSLSIQLSGITNLAGIYVLVQNSTFSNNQVVCNYYSGPLMLLTGALGIDGGYLQSLQFLDCSFSYNMIIVNTSSASEFIEEGAAIYINAILSTETDVVVEITNCTFDSNQLYSFADVAPKTGFNEFAGAAVSVIADRLNMTITSCTFTRNQITYLQGSTGVGEGGAVYFTGSTLRVLDCEFTEQLIHIENFFCYSPGSALVAAAGAGIIGAADFFYIENTKFLSNTAEVYCSLTEGGKVVGAASYLVNCELAEFTNVVFNDNLVYGDISSGGAVACDFPHSFKNCSFSENHCVQADSSILYLPLVSGGAVVTVENVTFIDCTFEWNSANVGGAIALVDSTNATLFSNVQFTDNEAIIGGGLYIPSHNSTLSFDTFGTFVNDTAQLYGDWAATKPFRLETAFEYPIVYPGEVLDLKFILTDSFGNIVGSEVYTFNINTNQNPKFISHIPGDTLVNSPENPVYEIASATILGPVAAGNIVNQVDFSVTAIADTFIQDSVFFVLVDCLPGYFYSTSSQVCKPCSSLDYLFDQYSSCISCPLTNRSCMKTNNVTAALLGKYVTSLGPGIWPTPSFLNPTTLLKCPNEEACLQLNCSTSVESGEVNWTVDCNIGSGFESNTNPSPYCATGYTDRMCSRCVCNEEDGCWYPNDYQCVECDNSIVIAFYITMFGFLIVTGVFFTLPLGGIVLVVGEILVTLLLAFAGFISWSGFITSAWMLLMVSAMSNRINTATLKTLLTYVQLVQLLSAPNFWPSWIPNNSDANGIFVLPGMNCLFTGFAENPEWKFVFSMLIPIVLVLNVLVLSAVGYVIRLAYRKYFPKSQAENASIQNEEAQVGLLSDFDSNREESSDSTTSAEKKPRESPINASTLKAGLFIAYSSYIPITGAVLIVLQPCENGYFRDIPWIECSWDNSVYSSLVVSGIVFLMLYVVGIPLMFGLLLYRYRKHLHADTPIGKAVEFLYEEFRPAMYYYELVWMTRRLLLVMGIMLIPADSGWQFGFCAAVMGFSLFLQSVCQPFAHRYDNFAEIVASISVAIVYGVSVVDVLLEVNDNSLSNVFTVYFFTVLVGLFFLTFSPLILSRFQWYKNFRNTNRNQEQTDSPSDELEDLGSEPAPDNSQTEDIRVEEESETNPPAETSPSEIL